MADIAFRKSMLWSNIGEVAVQTGILALPGHFYTLFAPVCTRSADHRTHAPLP